MKYAIRITVLLAVFLASLFFFGSNMDEAVFRTDKTTVEMAEAVLPTVQLRSDGVVLDRLYGYTISLDLLTLREAMVTVESEQVLELLIDERGSNVRKLLYEVVDTVTGEETAEGTINAFDREEERKTARLKIAEPLVPGREYAVRVTLVTSESKRVYYYFRLKRYEDAHLAEKAQFLLSFSENARNKDYNAVIPYLESTYRGEGTTYAKVNIKDSYYMVCWGNLEPTLLGEPQLTFSELYSNVAVGMLRYLVEVQTDTGLERYYITEKFRIICTEGSRHLLNYERSMEAVFDVGLTSLSRSEFKLGVTSQTDPELVTNGDNSMLAFVRNRELWYYNLAENRMEKVFSMRGAAEEELGGSYEEHDVRILNMYDNGDVSFMAYGYMNRGEYEGKTGIVLYRYYRAEGRIEEVVYIPVSETYQQLKEELGGFSYMNRYDVFSFMVYRTMYCYDLTTRELTVLSERAKEDSVVFSRERGYVAWQEEGEDSKISLLYLETQEQVTLSAPSGGFLRLLGKIDENMICAYGKREDCVSYGDSGTLYPASLVQITDSQNGVLKSYQKEGYYVTDVQASGSSVRLERVSRAADGTYVDEKEDYILNYEAAVKKAIALTSRITEKMFIEYYISLPSGYVMKELPGVTKAFSTVIAEDTTLRIEELWRQTERYEVYSFGAIAAIYENCASAILLADDPAYVGTVADERGRVIWERGVKYSAYYITDVKGVSCKASGLTGRQAAVQTLLNRYAVEADAGELSAEASARAFLSEKLSKKVIALNGITLDEALYFVYRGMPVMAMKNRTDAVLITGYSSTQVVYYDPAEGQARTVSLRNAQEMFSAAGDSYLVVIAAQ